MTEVIAFAYTITRFVLFATAAYSMFLMLFTGWSYDSTSYRNIVWENMALFFGSFVVCAVGGVLAFVVGTLSIFFPTATLVFAAAFFFVLVKAFMVRVKQAFFERR